MTSTGAVEVEGQENSPAYFSHDEDHGSVLSARLPARSHLINMNINPVAEVGRTTHGHPSFTATSCIMLPVFFWVLTHLLSGTDVESNPSLNGWEIRNNGQTRGRTTDTGCVEEVSD